MDSNNELKKIDVKNRMCYYSDEIIKIEDFDPDKILINEKSEEVEKEVGSMEVKVFSHMEVKNMIPFTTELDI